MKLFVLPVIAALAALLWAIGNYHVVWGTLDRLHLERKVSWSPSETFINTDEIAGVQSDAIRAQRWPLYLQTIGRPQKNDGSLLTEYQRIRDARGATPAKP